jgi:hypothetical protein
MRCLILLLCCAGVSWADQSITLMIDADIQVDSSYDFWDLFVGADVDSFTLVFEGDITYGEKVVDGVVQPALVMVLVEMSVDDFMNGSALPPDGHSIFTIRLKEHWRPIPETVGLRIDFWEFTQDGSWAIIPPYLEKMNVKLVVHESNNVAGQRRTFGYVKALYR